MKAGNTYLLVALNAKYIHSNLAIYSLKAYAEQRSQVRVELGEYTINQSIQDIIADIYKKKPNFIGFSCYIWNWREIGEIMTELHKLLPQVPIWLGGPEVSYCGQEVLDKYPFVSGIMVGEGEETFLELCSWYEMEQKDEALPERVRGLYLPNIGYTGERELLDMDQLPFVYEKLENFQNRIIYYESSRGCPYSCSYCLSSIERKLRFRSLSKVKRELKCFLDARVPQVKFIDRTFNCDRERGLEIWRFIKENDNGVTNFHFEISGDILRPEEIRLLNSLRPGLAQLEIGVQSTNPKTIEAIHRVMNVERLEEAVKGIQEGHNIHQHLDLIAGLPYEDMASFRESFNRVYSMRPENLQLGFLKVLKGSPMESCTREFGLEYLSQPPYEVLFSRWISYEEICRLKKIEEMVELYYNSCQFTHTLALLESAFPDPFSMYESLALFYEKGGYFTNAPARAYRYEILLQFAIQHHGEYSEAYKELLTYDLYLRENLKSIPAFAPERNTAEDREYIRLFYQREEQERCYLPAYTGYDWKQLSKMTALWRFTYSVWEKSPEQILRRTDRYCLFDYKERNPLNQDARVVLLP